MKIHWLLAAFLPALIGSIDGSQAPLERETIFCHSIDLRTNALRKLTPLPPLCDEIPSLKKMKVDIGECRLHVETEGDGVPLVLINGGPGGTHHDFHPVFSRAANFARIIYYDQRGCGQSDYRPGTGYSLTQAVHDLERLREELKIERWAVLGWSYGGWLAQHYLLRYPERVRGLVLVGASPAAELNLDSTRQYDFLSRQERRRIQEIYDDASLTPVEAIFNAHAAGDWKRQHYYRPTVEQLARGALYGWKHDPNFRRAIQSRQIEPPNPDRFHGCPVPVLIAEGIWDLTWNTDKPKKFQACFPGAELVLFENSGHAPFQDEPGIFFGKLEQFLTKRPPTETEMARWKEKLAADDRELARLMTNISDTVTFHATEPVPEAFDFWRFVWKHPVVESGGRVGYEVRFEDDQLYYRWGPQQISPGGDSQSDFVPEMVGPRFHSIAGKKIRIRFWVNKGKIQFPEDAVLSLEFHKKDQSLKRMQARRSKS